MFINSFILFQETEKFYLVLVLVNYNNLASEDMEFRTRNIAHQKYRKLIWS